MADKKITELTEETVVEDDEPLAIVDDPGGTPTTKKVKAKNLLRKSVTFIIASSTSVGGADYYCDGTDDDVQIQAAIDALPSAGGKIILREGSYTIGNSILIAKDGVSIYGQGKGTIVTMANSVNKSMFVLGHATTQYYNTVFRDLYLDHNGANQTNGSGSIIDNGYTKAVWIKHVLVEGCYLINADDAAVYSESNSYCMVRNNRIENWGGFFNGSGVYVDANTSSVIGNVLIGNGSQNYYTGIAGGRIVIGNHLTMPDSFAGRAIYQGPAGTPDQIIDNYIYMGANAASSAIGIYGAGECVGNRIEFGTGADVASTGIRNGCDLVVGNQVMKAGIGIKVGSSTVVNGNVLSQIRTNAITLDGVSKSTVTGNSIQSPGMETNDTYSGILLTNTATNNIINGNTISSNQSNKHKYGIREASSSDDKNIITSNQALNAVTAQISTQGASTVSANNVTA